MPLASNMIRELLENGVHFGHQTNKWNPKMKKYIFGEKSGIYIIDLMKTEEALQKACDMLYTMASEGKTVLFAGTKKQAKGIIKEEAQRCGMFYVDERWLGGCLTNFTTVRRSVDKLNHIQEMKASEIYEGIAKKEKARIDREEFKLLKNLAGIRDMKRLPDCVVVVDAELEDIAIKEARKIGIPVVALIDTNCNPDLIEYPIPGNDDAIRSIKYIISTLADAVKKGHDEFLVLAGEKPEPDKAPETKPEVEVVEKEPAAAETGEDPVAETPAAEDEVETVEEEAAEEVEVKDEGTEETPEEEVAEEVDETVEGDIKLDGTGA